MAKRKDFGVGGPPLARVAPIAPSGVVGVGVATLLITQPDGHVYEVDHSGYLGQGFDDTVSAMMQVLRAMVIEGKPKPLSLKTIARGGVDNWFRFCSERAAQGTPPTLNSINREMMEAFAGWLKTRVKANGELWSINSARTVFQKTKTVLQALVDRRLVGETELFPRNLFSGATNPVNRRNYIRPLSDDERERILRPLAAEVAQVFDGVHPGGATTQLGLCVFAIFLKTGVNPTPFLEIPRDLTKCFLEHPRVNRKVLVTFKRRARAFTTTPIEPWSDTRVVSLDVYKLCERAVYLTEGAAKAAEKTAQEGKLWVYESKDGVRGLTTASLSAVANSFSRRHNLLRDDGSRLKMTSQLFRNTKLNRVWRASRGDLLATAKSASNTPAAAERYLTVTPDMLEEHRMAGEVLVEMLSGATPRDDTPHSGCRDAINGELAPKNGEPCVDFLSCFRCKTG